MASSRVSNAASRVGGEIQFSSERSGGTDLGSTSRWTTGMMRLLPLTAWASSRMHSREAMESGLNTKTNAFDWSMLERTSERHLAVGGMSSTSTQTSRPSAWNRDRSASTKSRSLREYEMKISGTAHRGSAGGEVARILIQDLIPTGHHQLRTRLQRGELDAELAVGEGNRFLGALVAGARPVHPGGKDRVELEAQELLARRRRIAAGLAHRNDHGLVVCAQAAVLEKQRRRLVRRPSDSELVELDLAGAGTTGRGADRCRIFHAERKMLDLERLFLREGRILGVPFRHRASTGILEPDECINGHDGIS